MSVLPPEQLQVSADRPAEATFGERLAARFLDRSDLRYLFVLAVAAPFAFYRLAQNDLGDDLRDWTIWGPILVVGFIANYVYPVLTAAREHWASRHERQRRIGKNGAA